MKPNLVGICWLMTTKCNLDCPICYRHIDEQEQLEYKARKQIANRLSSIGVRKVTFAGGEPLLYPNVTDLLEYVNKLGIKTGLCSNALLLTEEHLTKLETCLDEWTVPIDGSNAEIHARSRGLCKSFDVSLSLLKLIGSVGFSMDISTVVSKQNQHDLARIAEIVLQSRVKKWKIFQFFPMQRGWEHRDRFEISQEEFASAVGRLAPYRAALDIDVRGADEGTMRSYLHISPSGRMLLVENNQYKDIGDFMACSDINTLLEQNEFNFGTHQSRHRRDIVVSASGANTKSAPRRLGSDLLHV